MAQTINTNVLSLTAQRNLNQSGNALSQSIQRLSSGLRINSAKDDAAGLAISERFTAQIRGLNQAQRNANDGISFSQTAEGALGTIGDSLQRIRELAVQAANDTNSSSDRQSLNNEVQQLIGEINRVAASTEFNGQKILNGNASELVFQVGANQGQTISVTGVDARTSQLGANLTEGAAISANTLTSGTDGAAPDVGDFTDISVNGVAIDLSGAGSLDEVVSSINNVTGDTNVTASRAREITTGNLAFSGDFGTGGFLEINGVQIDAGGLAAGTPADVTTLAERINAASDQTGVTAEVTGTDFVLTADTDIEIAVTEGTGGSSASFGGLTDGQANTLYRGIDLATDVGGSISVAGTDDANLGLDSITLDEFNVASVSVTSRSNASDALQTIDFALQQVNGLRAELGAVQSRFENTITNLSTQAENLSAARSRIQDADFAAETAALTRAQILQQAGISALAQANAAPQSVLSLLG